MTGTPRACRQVSVKHAKGASVVQFWAYSQRQQALMGDVVDWYHVDEEPEDEKIYPQVLTRTLNGDKNRGGRGILTLTPENGKTELVCSFMDDEEREQKCRYIQTATWDDAPHLTEETKEQTLAAYPSYQRAMRSRGVPLQGAGLIYEHDPEKLKCPRFSIPSHFWLINGMDFGWDHPQAHIQLAIDPDSATIYVVQAWKASKKQPYEAWESVKHWAENVPTAWPGDGQQHKVQSGNRDAVKQKDLYVEQGWEMLDEPACWPDGGNGVSVGLVELNKLMQSGRFKVFEDLTNVLEEIKDYHTKTNANGLSVIVKVKDDLLDAIRYAFMMARFAERKETIDNSDFYDQYEDEPYDPPNAMGY